MNVTWHRLRLAWAHVRARLSARDITIVADNGVMVEVYCTVQPWASEDAAYIAVGRILEARRRLADAREAVHVG